MRCAATRVPSPRSGILTEMAGFSRRDHLTPWKGGHFATREQPQAFSEELRVSFRSLR